ncbi:DUF1883 domain-containing protein [Kitasatospora sp. RG8]|uniref:DUF1883 domain-containing protein n=1 Tax=Kitasatospora sp. RG8 TaxID=2820815 RepID=UPI001AE03CE1|nr:DUF1883 domain-containing protein [Kitasatospora sp. RG8]MBP0453615.1 DUF1883 domain-containing protein [Kitasatospora sp. RG8]
MDFIVHDLGRQPKGAVVVINLSGSAANVRLMDSSNFHSYKSGGRHQYVGGLATQTPVRLAIPSHGQWYVTVDMIGLRGTVRSSARVEPPPLPALRPIRQGSLAQIRHEPPPAAATDESVWDVFISHASEDKADVAAPLARCLQDAGVSVWLDALELKIGDSLRRRIDQGLARSGFGVVVFSRAFFKKGWTQYELDGIVTRSVSGEQSLLPIWHNITKDEVIAQSPSLADKLARSTAQHTVAEIAREIADVVIASRATAS